MNNKITNSKKIDLNRIISNNKNVRYKINNRVKNQWIKTQNKYKWSKMRSWILKIINSKKRFL